MLVYLVNNGAYKIEASGLHKENKTCKLDYGKQNMMEERSELKLGKDIILG
jgi:hypothetical protein